VSNSTKAYDEARKDSMSRGQFGLTSLYNRFHSPNETAPDIQELRRLHGEMDVAVLRAYGWDDLADQAAQPGFCQFLLDYEEDEDDTAADSSSTRQKKKPWRYRWPDPFRDEVLARLLALNAQRHKEEQLAGKHSSHQERTLKDNNLEKKTKRKKSQPDSTQQEMEFDE
jgi:hypothetical protein